MFVWKIVSTIAIVTNHYLIYFESVGWSAEFRQCVVDVSDEQSNTQLSLEMYKLLVYDSCYVNVWIINVHVSYRGDCLIEAIRWKGQFIVILCLEKRKVSIGQNEKVEKRK